MVGAHQHQIAQLRRTTIRPMTDVVTLTMPGRTMTPGERAAPVPQVQGVTDRPGNQATQPPHVQRLTVGAEHRGDDLAVTGMYPGLGRRDGSGIAEESGAD